MPLSDCAARKRAQRSRPKNQACERCGKQSKRIDGHHPDIKNEPETVVYLCPACHAIADQEDGKRWKNPLKHTLGKTCCATVFRNSR